MSARKDLGDDLHRLAVALDHSLQANQTAPQQAARRLRETLPIDDRARDALARVLRLPLSLIDDWLADTLDLLGGDHPGDAVPAVVVDRLSAMAWAWGTVPLDWPAHTEDDVRRRWTVERAR